MVTRGYDSNQLQQGHKVKKIIVKILIHSVDFKGTLRSCPLFPTNFISSQQ
jgi:hypothetical protein